VSGRVSRERGWKALYTHIFRVGVSASALGGWARHDRELDNSMDEVNNMHSSGMVMETEPIALKRIQSLQDATRSLLLVPPRPAHAKAPPLPRLSSSPPLTHGTSTLHARSPHTRAWIRACSADGLSCST
jgi:hypothetical protein